MWEGIGRVLGEEDIGLYGVKEIADYFRRSPVAIGEGIRKVEGLLRKDISLEEALKRMVENVVKGKKRKYRISVA